MIVTPTPLLIPNDDQDLVLALDRVEREMNLALELGQYHRTYTRYQHLKLLREERAWRAIGNFRKAFGVAAGE